MRIWKVLLLGALCLKMAGCGFEAAPTSTFEPEQKQMSEVIYGDDSIKDVVNAIPNSESSVALVKKSALEQFRKDKSTYTVSEKYGVDDLTWSDQPALAFCSGILLGQDLVLTAGHCIENVSDCSDIEVVLNFEADKQDVPVQSVTCKEIVKSRNDIHGKGLDYAVLRLVHETKAPFVKIRKERLKVKDDVYTLGYPLGTYKKKALGKIRKVVVSPEVYISNLDTFEGNSGSPVFSSKTNELVGVVSSGESDFVPDSKDDSVMRVKRCSNNGCSGEFITPIEKIVADMNK